MFEHKQLDDGRTRLEFKDKKGSRCSLQEAKAEGTVILDIGWPFFEEGGAPIALYLNQEKAAKLSSLLAAFGRDGNLPKLNRNLLVQARANPALPRGQTHVDMGLEFKQLQGATRRIEFRDNNGSQGALQEAKAEGTVILDIGWPFFEEGGAPIALYLNQEKATQLSCLLETFARDGKLPTCCVEAF